MKIISLSILVAVAHLHLLPVTAKSYGSKPSGGSTASRPSSPSYGGSSPSYSSPTASRPSSPSPYSPSASRPAVKTPAGPISSTTRSPYNPSPAYKPLSTSGAPTVRSGGGGYGSTVKKVVAGAAIGAAVTIAAGYFLYGGRHSSPYCRGGDADRFLSGRCPRGTSSQSHECKSNIPLCPIPELVRNSWALGSDALPKVDVLFDKSVCSVVALEPADIAISDTYSNSTTETNSTNMEAISDTNSNSTTETNSTDMDSANSTRHLTNVEGESGLDACFRRIIAAGGCSDYTSTNMFQYDEDSKTCGCCSSVQVTTLAGDVFASAIYNYREPTTSDVAPAHCISGSTMFYPDVAGGPDVAHACECGACGTCGGGAARYMDWSGPFVVSDDIGSNSFVDEAKTQPIYDPVDTCLCDDVSASQCEGLLTSNSAGHAGGLFSSNFVVVSSALFLYLGRRG